MKYSKKFNNRMFEPKDLPAFPSLKQKKEGEAYVYPKTFKGLKRPTWATIKNKLKV